MNTATFTQDELDDAPDRAELLKSKGVPMDGFKFDSNYVVGIELRKEIGRGSPRWVYTWVEVME